MCFPDVYDSCVGPELSRSVLKSQTLGGFVPQTPRPRTLTVTYMYLSSPLMCWTTPFLKKTLLHYPTIISLWSSLGIAGAIKIKL